MIPELDCDSNLGLILSEVEGFQGRSEIEQKELTSLGSNRKNEVPVASCLLPVSERDHPQETVTT